MFCCLQDLVSLSSHVVKRIVHQVLPVLKQLPVYHMFQWALMEPSSPHLTMEPRGLQGLLGNQTVFKELSTQTVPS